MHKTEQEKLQNLQHNVHIKLLIRELDSFLLHAEDRAQLLNVLRIKFRLRTAAYSASPNQTQMVGLTKIIQDQEIMHSSAPLNVI